MQENKNLVEEALIQMKNVEEAIAENAKGILASTMKEEINQLVKESLSEQDEIDIDAEMGIPSSDEELGMNIDVEDDVEGDMGMELDMDAEESPIDLTGASDEEILKVFKAMGEEDGIIVTKDDEEIQLTDNDSDNEYIIKLKESKSKINEDDMVAKIVDDIFNSPESEDEEEKIDFSKLNSDDEDEMAMAMDSEEEMMYEITLDEEDGEDDESKLDEEDGEDDESKLDEEDGEDDESKLDEESDDESILDEEDGEDDESILDEESDDESLDEAYNHKKAIKPKGVGIGSGPKFSYKATKGGFNEKKKEGPKSVGTGKAKFEYKKGANMEGTSKKVETKEGHYGMNKGDKSKTHKGDEDYTTKKGDTLKRKAFTKEETKEAARTYGMGSKEGRGLRKGITNNRNYVYGPNGVKVESLEAEVSMLREKNEEYRKALNLFREKLNEVAIFNSNLAYATRLFTEHSTTKKEKINILRRFDSVETLKESKSLYKSIKDELSTVETKSITESVEKLNTTVSSGSAINLIESKTYENPQFLRMKDLMTKIK